jgi:hypothetical protein
MRAATPGNVMAWQDRRYQFAYQVGQLLVDSGPGIPPVSDHAVYGVYVTGGGLLYVGQTRDARRRLRDLPVGESHHLATTVPPETWERVLVIPWPALITRIPAQEAQRTEQLGPASCGLGIEYLLQITYQPVMTARRRSTAGGWSARHIETSRSRVAAAQHSAARDLSGSTSTVGPARPSARARRRPGGYLLRRRARRVSRLALTSHCPMRPKRRSPSRQGGRFDAPR